MRTRLLTVNDVLAGHVTLDVECLGRIFTRCVDVTINASYKDGRAMRIETVINNPNDLGVLRRLQHLDELQAKARDVTRRLLDHEQVGQGCVLASSAFERIARPSLVDGRRAPALRFGDPRVLALAGAWPSRAT